MNYEQIEKVLYTLEGTYKGKGKIFPTETNYAVIELLLKFYIKVEEVDWEEIVWLFSTYMDNGTLDFAKAKRMGMIRAKNKMEGKL